MGFFGILKFEIAYLRNYLENQEKKHTLCGKVGQKYMCQVWKKSEENCRRRLILNGFS